MTEHTLGPWIVYNDGYGDDVEPPEPGKRWLTIADIDQDEVAILVNRKGEPTDRQNANARLIAATPDLLDALVTLADHAQEAYPHFEQRDIQAAIDAIAKATGTENRA